jgi:hypothetical protein
MMRFCKNVLQQGFPKDIVWYYIQSAEVYRVPVHLDTSRMELFFEAMFAKGNRPIKVYVADNVFELLLMRGNDIDGLLYRGRLLRNRDEHDVLPAIFFHLKDIPTIRRVVQFLPDKGTHCELRLFDF